MARGVPLAGAAELEEIEWWSGGDAMAAAPPYKGQGAAHWAPRGWRMAQNAKAALSRGDTAGRPLRLSVC